MKIIINENQLHLIKENIDPSEGYDEISSVKTIVDGKRNVAFIASLSNYEAEIIGEMISDNDLDSVRVPSNPHHAYIIFRKGHENQAHELLNMAEKYGGYLSHKASEEDVREIGRLLEYNPESVEEFIINKRNENKN